jgi:hypothetical protein
MPQPGLMLLLVTEFCALDLELLKDKTYAFILDFCLFVSLNDTLLLLHK